MNYRERQMLVCLKKIREEVGCLAVKAEFEAEGTRVEELLRLVDIARKAGVDLALKIGGCEAVRDLMESKQIGVEYIIAPMVETPYALTKYIDAKNKIYDEDEQKDTAFLFNIETKSSFDNVNEMLELAAEPKGLDGVVFGRVDFSSSLKWPRDTLNSANMAEYCAIVANGCRSKRLDFVVGGGISIDSVDFLRELHNVHLTRFETRKVVFPSSALDSKLIKEGLLEAVKFELLWLLNKQDYYSSITKEDILRIEMLQNRWKLPL
jgi:hypothetical protein